MLNKVRFRRDVRAGYSLLEVMVTLALLALILVISIPPMQRWVQRNKLEGVARQTSTLMQVARFEAIRSGQPVVVRLDPASAMVDVYFDLDGDGLPAVSEPVLRRDYLPQYIEVRGPGGSGGGAIDGFTAIAGLTDNRAVFLPDGSVDAAGAYRFADAKDNYLEVRVEPVATAHVSLRKWDETASEWHEQGEGGENWKWKM